MIRPSEKWSPRRTLAFVVVSSLFLWPLIIGAVALLMEAVNG